MSKSRDIADSAATINYIDGLTSDAQSQIDTATSDIATNTSDIAANTADIATKAPLSNPTFTGTVTADGLQVGSGTAVRAIETFGSVPSWRLNDTDVSGLYHEFVGTAAGTASLRIDHANVDSNSDFDISVDGAVVAVFDSTGIDVTGTVTATAFSGDGSGLTGVDSLPSQTGESGKFLTTDGTNASWDAVDVSSEITGTLPVANGGTGTTTLTANNVLLGNGTSAPLAVAPSTSGNVLTSNGTTWESVAPAGGGLEEYITKVELVSPASQIVIDNSAFSSSDYDYLILRGYNFTFSGSTYMQIRYRSGGVAKDSQYGNQMMYAYSSTGYFNAGSATQSRINFINPSQTPNANTSFVDFEIKLNHLSEYRMFYAVGYYQRGTTGALHTQIGWHQDSTGYTFGGIEFNTSGANYNSGCILKLYGVKEQ